MGDDVPTKVRVFGLKKLFLKRFTVRCTTRTLITDKNDHSAFTAISYYCSRSNFLQLYMYAASSNFFSSRIFIMVLFSDSTFV
jgi:hypothetical protein